MRSDTIPQAVGLPACRISEANRRLPSRLVAAIVGSLLVVVSVVACSDRDRGRPILIVNGTSETVIVSYRVITPAGAEVTIGDSMRLEAGSSAGFMSPFLDGSTCARGTLFASTDGLDVHAEVSHAA